MSETLVGTLSFPVMGKDGKVYKEDVENGNLPVLGRDATDNSLIVQLIMASASTDQQILDTTEAKFNAKGWY